MLPKARLIEDYHCTHAELADNDRCDGEASKIINAFPDILDWAKNNLARGDLVRFGCNSDYRNDGIVIYDGTKFVDLDYDKYMYGCIPLEFQVVTEFPVDHWCDVLPYHSDVVRFGNIQMWNVKYHNEQRVITFDANHNVTVICVIEDVLNHDAALTRLEAEMADSYLLCRLDGYEEDIDTVLKTLDLRGKTVLYWLL